MKTIEDIQKMCNDLAIEHGFDPIEIPIVRNNRFSTCLGRVDAKRDYNGECFPVTIQFAGYLLDGGTDADIEDVVKHEMAHYFVFMETGENHQHDKVWQDWANKLGCNPKRINDKISNQCLKQRHQGVRYRLVCPKCGRTFQSYKTHCKTVIKAENGAYVCPHDNETIVVEELK